MADTPIDETMEVIIRDSSTSDNELKVNSDGSINTVTATSSLVLDQKVFAASFEVNVATAAETNVVLLRNPAGSGKVLQFQRAVFILSNTVSSQSIIRMYANPTVTGTGSAQSILNTYLKTSPASTVMQVYASPTTSALGTRFYAVGTTGGTSLSPFANIFDGSFALDPGRDILITARPDGTNRNHVITLFWSEA